MALFTPSESPAIVVKEVDLTGVAPNVQSTTGAIVGNFRWGPVEQTVLVDNESTLVSTFGSPDNTNAVDFLSAAYFLKYSGSLQTVRAVGAGAVNARYPYTAGQAATLVKNKADFEIQQVASATANQVFVARYPGILGNSIGISICPPSVGDTAFTSWVYRGSFDGSPSTSEFAFSIGALNDEVHIAVIDTTGDISGTPNTVLETFPYVSLASNAKTYQGASNYILDVVNKRSAYIHINGFGVASSIFAANAGTPLVANANWYDSATDEVLTASFDSAGNGAALGTAEYINGYALFNDKDTITIDFLIAPGMATSADQATVVNDLQVTAGSLRKDCIVVASPNRDAVVGNAPATIVSDTTATTFAFTNTSYIVCDNNYLKVYDKYNDKYVFIPASSSTAGIMAASDANSAAWFSPAGSRRGQYLGITSLAYNPTKAERDTLYKASVNPIANIPGQGVLLYGDKTNTLRPGAFDRINVRRLFLLLERSISTAAQNVMFEINDEFTRAEFVNIIEPLLREIKGRRGITDFRVVCDETNNTAAVVDRNEFIASVFVKPARSINYITLNFVAVRTGVEFEEVVGTV